MKAMILAAGLGTRLRPLTDDRPKALVEVGGRTLLEITLRRLRCFGVREVIVNVHHFADLVVEYLKANDDFGMRIEISREDDLLDTGGGLKKAADFFLRDDSMRGEAARGEPFILHNVDVLSSIDLGAMVEFHREHEALATLAMRQRESSRLLLFDEHLQLCGRRVAEAVEAEMVRPAWETQALAFSGIHVVSPRIFSLMKRALTSEPSTGEAHRAGKSASPRSGSVCRGGEAFPIVPMYLRLAAEGEKILAYRTANDYWRDLGTVASLRQAAEDVARKVFET
jgi:NDP-sugar pyrophosphorylase family protein